MVLISYTVDCGVNILKLIEMFFCIPHISIPIFLVLEINRIKSFVENGGPILVFALLLSNLDPSDRQDPPLHVPTSSILLSTLLKSIGHWQFYSLLGAESTVMPSVASLCHLLCSWPSPWILGLPLARFP